MDVQKCNDIVLLKNELKKTKLIVPECTAHMFYLQERISLLTFRINQLTNVKA